MRVAIDIQTVIGRPTGVGRFVLGLVRGLAAADAENRYLLFYPDFRRRFGGLDLGRENVSNAPIRLLPGTLLERCWGLFSRPPLDSLVDADLFHFTNYLARPLRRARSVVSVYDLAFVRMPETVERRRLRLFLKGVPRSLRQADAVIVPSRFTAGEVREVYGTPEEKLHVVYPGVGKEVRRPARETIAAARKRHGLPERYLLSLATLEPRKNFPSLFRAFRALKERPGFGRGLKLAVAGLEGWLTEPILREARALGSGDDILFLGYVPREDLPAIYGGALAFVFLSLYEGFGFPPLEAMACGTPVVCSKAASLPEVAGDAALLVDPKNVGDAADAIGRVLTDEGLRKRLSASGPRRAAEFTWERTAREAIRVYKKVLGVKEEE